MQLLLEVFVLSFGFGFAVYAYFTWKLFHFERKKIPYLKGYPIFGNWAPIFFRQVAFSDYVVEMYNGLKGHRFGGIFEFTKPAVLIKDPELIKQIMVKDFDHFTDRHILVSEEADELFGKSVFSLQGQRWRNMRATLSPAFTGSKMRAMFVLVEKCAEQLVDYLDTLVKNHEGERSEMVTLEMKDLFSKCTNDVIGTCAFGIQCNSHLDPDNDFYKHGKDLTNSDGIRTLIVFGYMISIKFMKFLRIPLLSKAAKKFLHSAISETIAIREQKGIIRPDMVHLLMQARKGELKSEADEEETINGMSKVVKADLSDEDITAQALVFFFAGFDTSSTLLTFTTYLLAVHPDVQQRLQEEVDAVMEECGSKLTYDSLQKLKYMDMVLSETLRLYPVAVSGDRKCVKPYTIPATSSSPSLTFEAGDALFIPVVGFHRDPEYFQDPLKFDPERFSDENKHNIKPFTYMPFGVGPRNCIGMRFALMEVKEVLAMVISRFSLHVVSKTEVPIVLSKKDFHLTTDAGFWLGVTHREKS